MNGAHALLETLMESGIEVCFSNPGTSEMHLVTAIGKTDNVRSILCLFEGVVSGAADGYARLSGKPAITLLHLGPGYANSMANLHNARRARSAIVNIVGDHAVWHHQHDAPLTSDVEAHVKIHSHWYKFTDSAEDLSMAGAEAVSASLSGAGRIATLVVPANHAWESATKSYDRIKPEPLSEVPISTLDSCTKLLNNGRKTAFVLGGRALHEDTLELAGRISESTGVTLLGETFPARLQRGAGRVPVARVPYFAEQAIDFLAEFEQLILIGAPAPVAFFAYPGVSSTLFPDNCMVSSLAMPDEDILQALTDLTERIGAPNTFTAQPAAKHKVSSDELTPTTVGQIVSLRIPENTILVDEGISSGLELFVQTQNAPKHDWLAITGGSIGYGLPVCLGASIACPDRKVVGLQADGSAMYTVQALWSMAREKTDVTIVLLNNSSYNILNVELHRTRAGEPTEKTLSMLDLSNPTIDWVKIAQGMGVSANTVNTVAEFDHEFSRAMDTHGPHLIEVILEQQIGAAIKR
ncbi:MAG: acetolactate synthase large subunit [Proteobacteria bacterium]|jgi:acetolactate synthase I/II/III large subunit|nr:acetolactate synthase large subunit [Pseudomonadota bacterium]MBT5066276.1 acetolactate synthase large subunit [Pseudomonadota bacterium]MBT6192115.1 acetolactate synthase large subunit [Pseudomonadota bacterium]MBT6464420.1 acetolactate synthase large subunit [Pseudomonadota bacterium]MBT7247311.1 acetolactate synthase large subunit [Pseudomonadota bacterium]